MHFQTCFSPSAMTNNAARHLLLASHFTQPEYATEQMPREGSAGSKSGCFSNFDRHSHATLHRACRICIHIRNGWMPVQFLSIWVTKTWICFLEHLSSSVCHCCKNMNFSFLRIRKLHIPPLFSVISFRCSQQGKNSSRPK